MSCGTRLGNYINGSWESSEESSVLEVEDPGTAQTIATVPLSTAPDVDIAVQAASEAFEDWRRTPATDRVQYLFRLKSLLEENLDELSKIISMECGKTLSESKGELKRGIENVETACGIPSLLQGYNNEDIAPGVDEHLFRQPLGVVAAITPFNFPAMIPMWFLPYAIATGNCFILKPSEKTPITSNKIFELISRLDLPPGVLQLIHGGKDAVDALLEHPAVRAISFVGSTPVARYVYGRAAANGKRAQCQGGAKNPVVIMPDADMEMTTQVVADAAFGCAGQRCLALSSAITVDAARECFTPLITDAAASRRVGYGLDENIEMGSVITQDSKTRIERHIDESEREGASVLVDGRGKQVSGYENGHFVFPTILQQTAPCEKLDSVEVFGPVMSLTHVNTIEEAISLVNRRSFGNMACIFTSSGLHARQFRYDADAGNVGINVGVAAPMAFFPFSGWNESFFGDLHAQGRHAIEFYTQTKVVVERWPKEWTRKF